MFEPALKWQLQSERSVLENILFDFAADGKSVKYKYTCITVK